MELLAANQIFDNSTVCELFSKVLCPGNQTIAFEVNSIYIVFMMGSAIHYNVMMLLCVRVSHCIAVTIYMPLLEVDGIKFQISLLLRN